jgi:hypothetical protein
MSRFDFEPAAAAGDAPVAQDHEFTSFTEFSEADDVPSPEAERQPLSAAAAPSTAANHLFFNDDDDDVNLDDQDGELVVARRASASLEADDDTPWVEQTILDVSNALRKEPPSTNGGTSAVPSARSEPERRMTDEEYGFTNLDVADATTS